MPAKIARSAPRPPFGLPDLLVAVHTSRQSCSKAGESANISARSGVYPGEYLFRFELLSHCFPPLLSAASIAALVRSSSSFL